MKTIILKILSLLIVGVCMAFMGLSYMKYSSQQANQKQTKYDLYVKGRPMYNVPFPGRGGAFFRIQVDSSNYRNFDLRGLEDRFVCVVQEDLAEFIIVKNLSSYSLMDAKEVLYTSKDNTLHIVYRYDTLKIQNPAYGWDMGGYFQESLGLLTLNGHKGVLVKKQNSK